jgi:hypothetical protein
MTLTELLGVYRSAVLTLIPVVTRIHMPWKDGESYDDWDVIAESLWKGIVVGAISDALHAERALDLPRYGFSYDVYASQDLLVVDSQSELLVVQQFVLDGSIVPRLKVSNVNPADRTTTQRRLVRLEDSRIILLRGEGHGATRIDEVPVSYRGGDDRS